MSFQSLDFLAFLAITAGLCYAAAGLDRHLAALCLTIASLLFYIVGGGWGAFLVLIVGLAVSAAAARYLTAEIPAGGRGAGKPAKSPACRRCCLACASAWHIGILAVFKYASFFTGGRISLSSPPLGLSFFTFQQLWLLKEVYTGDFRLGRRDSLPLYAFFFPTAVSGPILKPQAFFPQLHNEKFLQPDSRDVAAGLCAITGGMAKKVLLSDNLGVVVNTGWEHLAELSAPDAWLVILGYTLQLYLDFSGYCDIAAGSARLLGLRLPVNFNSPYRSLSAGEFWRRWHITLTGFLRECVYVPLGGSRRGMNRTCINILTVFLISGLWHGAGWTFIVWGGLHGLAQVAERLWGKRRDRLPASIRWLLTFFFVNMAWVFFRAPSLSGALALLKAAFAGGLCFPSSRLLNGVLPNEAAALGILLPALEPWAGLLLTLLIFGAALTVVFWPRNMTEIMERFEPVSWRCAVLAALAAWSILSFTGVETFIYSNF